MEGEFKEHHSRAQRQESEEEKAERLIEEGWARAGWKAGAEHKGVSPA
jgi:hypothetical protein